MIWRGRSARLRRQLAVAARECQATQRQLDECRSTLRTASDLASMHSRRDPADRLDDMAELLGRRLLDLDA
ncbi:MAG: hypothetical protein AB7O92_24590 [Acidimicrobiia bacterium]